MNWYARIKLAALPSNWMEEKEWNHHVSKVIQFVFPVGRGTSRENPHSGPEAVLMPGAFQSNGRSVDFEVTSHYSRYCIHFDLNLPLDENMRKNWKAPFYQQITCSRDCPKQKNRWSTIFHKRYEAADIYTPINDVKTAIERDAGCKDYDHEEEESPTPDISTPAGSPQLIMAGRNNARRR